MARAADDEQDPTLWIGYIALMTGVLMAFMFVVVCVALVIGASAQKQSLAEIAEQIEETGDIIVGENLSMSLKDGRLLIFGLENVRIKDEIVELASTIDLFLSNFDGRAKYVVLMPEDRRDVAQGAILRDAYFKYTLLLEQFEAPIKPFEIDSDTTYNSSKSYVFSIEVGKDQNQ